MQPFTHLQVYSNYSLLYGTRTIEELVAHAKLHGYTHLALTDINNVYGIHDFLRACKKESITPIIGCELRQNELRVVVLTKNKKGFSNITRLITAIHHEKELTEELNTLHNDIIILSDTEKILTLKGLDKKNLYAMITPTNRDNKNYITMIQNLRIPLVATGEVGLLEKEDWKVHIVLQAIHDQKTIYDIQSKLKQRLHILYSPEKIEDIFYMHKQAIKNTKAIAYQCNFTKIFDGFIFPTYTPKGPNEDGDILRQRTYDGAEKRYGELSESVMDRIEYELSIIVEKGFPSYFLIVSDIVSQASRTCGRGSAAASIVSYCLGITNVDPIRHNLYFERFLNPERVDPPDIDVDFAWDERDEIIDTTMRTFGEDHSAMVCTLIHFKTRSAVRDVARAYGLPGGEVTEMMKTASWRNWKHNKGPDKKSDIEDELDHAWKEVIYYAQRIKGFPKHLSVHVGGLIITPEPVTHYVPVEKAPKGVPIITWDKDGAEDAGLVKIDFLGNRSLAVIRDAIENLKSQGTVIDRLTWDPLSDKDTIGLLATGETMGVFYVESPAMRQLQKKTKKGDFEHLVIHSSIIRPAANRFINTYIDRLKGKPYKGLDPRLDHILKETYGIMCYQEDVSKVAVVLADFSPAEADGLRKILSKKNKAEKLEAYRKKFYTNAEKNGLTTDTIDEIWEMIISFEGYSFCKPHSASFALVSFQSAYLKAHHKAAFMAAVLSNGGGYYTASAYISEAKRMGLAILPPDINASDFKYKGYDTYIRVGFMSIGEIRFPTLKNILLEREKHGAFRTLEDLFQRVSIPPTDAEILISVGVLDSIAENKNRAEQLWTALKITHYKHEVEKENLLFIEDTPPLAIPKIKGPSPMEKLCKEYTYLSFLCHHHPLVLYHSKIKNRPSLRARDLYKQINKKISILGWLVTRKAILTNKGNPMEFVSFEDETAIFETVFFPETYEKYYTILDETIPFWITGEVHNDRGAIHIIVESVKKDNS